MRESESRRPSSHRDRDRDRDYYSRKHHHSKPSRSPTPPPSRSRKSKKSKSSKKYSRRRRSTSSSSSTTSYSSQESRNSSRKSKSHSRTSSNLTSSTTTATRKRAASSESNSQTATSTATIIAQTPKAIDVLDTKVQKQLEVIEEDAFVPKTFYSTRDREAPEKKPTISSDKVIIDLNSVTVTLPKLLDQSKEPEDIADQIFHQNFLGDAELKTEKWVRKLYNYRQKYTSE